MLFHSFAYIFIFLPIMVLGFRLLKTTEHIQNHHLILYMIAGSFFFYLMWRPIDIVILGFSVLINYLFAIYISRKHTHAIFLNLPIVFNIILLLYFKHSQFFFNDWGIWTHLAWDSTALPLAISFFTFQQIAFIVDIRQKRYPMPHFHEYLLYVTFWPQLIAGPIVRFHEVVDQYRTLSARPIVSYMTTFGFMLITMGLFKKVCIADNIAPYVDDAFLNVDQLMFWDAWSAAVGYTLQIYFDFSGYCDIALGSAFCLGIRLPINFDSPYQSCSINEFWRRWHITLGRFFKDYLYDPIRQDSYRLPTVCFAILITMFLSGLWHGAGYTFIVWGLLHGFIMCLERMYSAYSLPNLPRWLSSSLTLFFLIATWVIFRAHTMQDAIQFLNIMFDLGSLQFPILYSTLLPLETTNLYIQSNYFNGLEMIVFLVLLTACISWPNSQTLMKRQTLLTSHHAIGAGMITTVLATLSISPAVFLYFQF